MAEKVYRDPSFSAVNSDDISYFKEILGEKNVIQDEDRLLTANTDWMRKYKGSSKVLLQPWSTEEVHYYFLWGYLDLSFTFIDVCVCFFHFSFLFRTCWTFNAFAGFSNS